MQTTRIIGWVLVAIVSIILMAAGGFKLFALPPEALEQLAQIKLDDNIKLIGCGAILTGVLLLVPRTASLGVLMASAYWGGAICTHMIQDEAIVVPAALLAVTWVGATLRDPRIMGSAMDKTDDESAV